MLEEFGRIWALQLGEWNLRESRDAAGSWIAALQCLDSRHLLHDFRLQIDWPNHLECWSGGYTQGNLWKDAKSAEKSFGTSSAATGGRGVIGADCAVLRPSPDARLVRGPSTGCLLQAPIGSEQFHQRWRPESGNSRNPALKKESSRQVRILAQKRCIQVLRLFRLRN